MCAYGNTHPWICLQPCRAVSFSGSFRTFKALSSSAVSTSLFFVPSRARSVSYSECNSGGPMDPLLAVHPFIVLEDRRNELEKCLFVIKTSWLKHQWFFNFVSESLKTRSPESMEVRVPDLCIPHTMNPVVGWRSFASFKSSFGLLSMLTHLNLYESYGNVAVVHNNFFGSAPSTSSEK